MIGSTGTNSVQLYLHPEDVRSLIPEFTPEKITVQKWLRKIENLKNVYSWEERVALHYATIRLGTVPRIWYEGVEQAVDDWNDFKRRIVQAFPSRVDEVDIHSTLIRRVKQPDETYEKFIYDVVAIASMVDLTDAVIIKYIINGIPNSNLRLALSTAGHTSVNTLLEAILRYENQTNMQSAEGVKFSKHFQDHVRMNNKNRCCYNCGERGHLARTCFWKNEQRFQGSGSNFRQRYDGDARYRASYSSNDQQINSLGGAGSHDDHGGEKFRNQQHRSDGETDESKSVTR